MNVSTILWGVSIFLLCFFAIALVLPVLLKMYAAAKAKLTPGPATAPTGPSSNPFSDFSAKLAGMHKSWTIWFNALIAGVIPMLDYAQANVTALQPFIPANFYAWTMVGVIVGNIVLRFKTFESLAAKATPAVPPNVQPPTV